MASFSDKLIFASHREPESSVQGKTKPWKILIVDDEAEVHQLTVLILSDLEYANRGVEFLHAYSAAEGIALVAEHPDLAIILLDVVMESQHSGLEMVEHIRAHLSNRLVRIILRTGQPGQAPERDVILNYDINDYKEKTDLTANKLFSSVVTALRGYADLTALEKNRIGLEQIIAASKSLYDQQSLSEFFTGILTQLEALLGLGGNSFFSRSVALAGDLPDDDWEHQRIVAGTGEFANTRDKYVHQVLDPQDIAELREASQQEQNLFGRHALVIWLKSNNHHDGLLYLGGGQADLDDIDRKLMEVFASNASIALANLYLNREIDHAQREVLYTLGEIAEFRSRETGRHIARVSQSSALLAAKAGLSREQCHVILLAAAMHDIGKIAIPDEILHKPGRLDVQEWQVMQRHAELGYQLLNGSDRPLLMAAATIAYQHHEKWDGTGYPRGLSGEQIDLMGRIVAIADVFDALGSRRCYKAPWTAREIKEHIKAERGKHFDPHLTDLFLANIEEFLAIREHNQDDETIN